MPTLQYRLRSGENLVFHILNYTTDAGAYNEVGGIYMFCSLNLSGNYIPHYIGQTNNFKVRLPQHERWQEASALGATVVLAVTELSSASRDAIEQELIMVWQPALNDKFNGLRRGLFGTGGLLGG